MINVQFVVVPHGDAVSSLPGFKTVLDMIETALNSPDFVDLFFDLCRAFAEALEFQWVKPHAYEQWVSWTTTHPVPPEWQTILIDGRGSTDGFSLYDVETRRITLDTTLLVTAMRGGLDTTKAVFFLFVKGLHAVANSLTELILGFLKFVYRDKPRAERKRIPAKTTPAKIGRLPATKGDCGYQLEQLLSNNLRLSFQHDLFSRFIIDEIAVVSTNGRLGYYVPNGLVVAVAASPARFYILCKSFLCGDSVLEPIPERLFKTRVHSCGAKHVKSRGCKLYAPSLYTST